MAPAGRDPIHLFLHELKTPLTTLMGYLDLWSRQHPDLESRRGEALAVMKRNTHKLQLLIQLLEEWLWIQRGDFERMMARTPRYLEELEGEREPFSSIARTLKGIPHHPLLEKILFLLRLIRVLDDGNPKVDLRLQTDGVILTLSGRIASSHAPWLIAIFQALSGETLSAPDPNQVIAFFSFPRESPVNR